MFVQNTSLLFMQLGILSCNPIILGIHFLEHEPQYFRCKTGSSWHDCTKIDICTGSYDKYTGVSDVEKDPEFIDNWVVSMDLLCKKSIFIGMIGFSFFFGVVIAMFFVPQYSELNGKKHIFCASLSISIFA